MQKLLLPLLAFFLPSLGAAIEYQSYNVMSGTGFFVNRNYVITNAHVIKGCTEVTLKGAIPEHKGKVYVEDSKRDLAVIYTDMPPPQIAPLRMNIDDLKAGDKVMVVGYPGEAGAHGEYKVAQAEIQDIKLEEDIVNKRLYISDVVDHGNSGGPVFDYGGNVIGVVVAKAVIGTYYQENHEKIQEQKVGVAIGLSTLKQFLLDNGIFSEWGGNSVVYADNYIEQRALDYIVNVQCRLEENTPAAQ